MSQCSEGTERDESNGDGLEGPFPGLVGGDITTGF